jgi:hypothetical protein
MSSLSGGFFICPCWLRTVERMFNAASNKKTESMLRFSVKIVRLLVQPFPTPTFPLIVPPLSSSTALRVLACKPLLSFCGINVKPGWWKLLFHCHEI